MTRIALATCAALPNLHEDDAPLIGELERRGASAAPAVWDDPDIDWASFDLVVIRSTWDYSGRRKEFLRWAERVESVSRLANPLPVVRWNTDKHYLRELEAAGVPIVPTMWLEPERQFSSRALHTRFPANGDFVIKPAVSAGAVNTGRYTAIDAGSRGLAIQHAGRLLAAGRTVMVQRYLNSVDSVGERAHIFMMGEYSHSVLKGAMLDGPDVAEGVIYKEEKMTRTTATEEEIEASRHVIRTARRLLTEAADGDVSDQRFLYARVDLVSGDDGAPVLMELEMVEPSLFTALGDGALGRFADAIMERAV
ncbi:MAG TPA: hypothetical protein VGK35_11090 [Actinotalea sp.]